MYNFKSKELFINLTEKEIPPKNHPDYLVLRDIEKDKCINGITINGIFIWGSLYYHLNHHFIDVDKIDNRGNQSIQIERPVFRDNEWIIHEAYNQANDDKKGLIIGAARQISKTSLIVSLVTRQLFLFPNSEILGLFSSKPDKQTFTKKLQIALQHNTDFLVIPSIDKDLNKEFIRFGFTRKDNEPYIYSKLYMYLTSEGNSSEIGAGKLLKEGTKVFYNDKEGLIENCKVGDKIFGKDGNLTTITGVYPEKNVEMYQLTLSDGREITACKDHLWTVVRMDKTGNRTPKVFTNNTEFLFNNYQRKYFNSKLNKEVISNRYKLPQHECLNYEHQDILIDPYYLGLWLGDGTTNQPNQITNKDGEIIKFLSKFAIKNSCALETKKYSNRLVFSGTRNPINSLFKNYNLIKNKHIPEQYLRNTKEVRLEVLRGLMDTDGTIDTRGRIQIDLSDKKLANDVVSLIRSLGINCSVSERNSFYKKNNERINCKLSYRIYLGVVIKEKLFNITRKFSRQRYILPKQTLQNGSSIIKIEKVENGSGVCLKVDNEDKLFLAGDYIPTHNTINFYFMDEVAKNPFIETHEAVIPAINSRYGLRCSPIYTFTGGSVEKSKDAEAMFLKPSTYFMKEFDNEGKKTGLFLPGQYRSDFKEDINFVDWYNKKYDTNLPIKGELSKIEFNATDFDKANKVLDQEENLAKESSLLAYQKRKMYAPRKISDMFLKTESNPFSHLHSEFEKLLEYINSELSLNAKVVDLIGDEKTGITFKFSDKSFLNDYPVSDVDEWKRDAGVVLLDPPRLQKGTKLYTVSCDPFNMIKASKKASMASIYIMRRETSDFSDPYGGKIVAWYNGRKDITHFRKTLLQMMVLYGGMEGCCTLLHEAADDSLTQWFNEKNLGYLLENSYTLSKEICPTGNAMNIKGMRPTPNNQKYYLSKILDYLEEELPDGRLGLWRIMDPYLVKQLMMFDGELGVCDAIVGFGHCLMHLYKDSRYRPQIYKDDKPKISQKIYENAFGFNSNNSNFTKKSII
jgi:hypothetical protein